MIRSRCCSPSPSGRRRGDDPADLAASFHETIARAAIQVARAAADATGLDLVVCSGGSFQNARLLDRCLALGADAGLVMLRPHLLSPNDGAISFGQAAVAAARLSQGAPDSAPRTAEVTMCLGIPGRVVAMRDDTGLMMGTVDFGGVRRDVCLAYVADDIALNDYVVVHVGFAISKVDEEEALRSYAILREMSQLEELDWMREIADAGLRDAERAS